MKLIFRFLILLIANAAGLAAASYFIDGFSITYEFKAFLFPVLLLTLVFFILRPLIKLVLSPLILLTLGFFSLVINGTLLKLVDIYSDGLTIVGIMPLLYGTLIVTFAGLIGGAFKKLL